MDQLPRLGKRELICLLLFTCNYKVSVWRGFLFLWVLGMGYIILLWHSLSLPYNYLGCKGSTLHGHLSVMAFCKCAASVGYLVKQYTILTHRSYSAKHASKEKKGIRPDTNPPVQP